jgi:sugar phosphate isomerase/epimerase
LELNWDPQNSAAVEPDVFPAGYERLPKKRIGNVQVKAEGLIGRGKALDWIGIVAALRRDGYTGLFSLETHLGETAAARLEVSHECMTKLVRILG